MKNLFLLLALITLTFQSCSSSDDDDPIITVCETPINLSASEVTTISAVLNWENQNDALDVNVEYGLTGFVTGNGTVISTSQNSASIDGLISDTSYDFYVQALCSVNNTQSEVGTFTTNECQIPINLSISEITANSAVLNWENLNDNLDVNVEYGLTGFTVGNGTVISVSQNSIRINGLIPDSSYDFYVQATCSVNNMQSEVGTFTTNIPSPFVGTWSGTFAGDDTGTWTFDVSVNGDASGSTTRTAGGTFATIGSVSTSGSVISNTTNGNVETIGQITGTTVSGTWLNVNDPFSGTWIGNLE